MQLTEEQQTSFRERGYLVVEDLISPEELQRLSDRTDEILDERNRALAGGQVVDQFGSTGGAVLRKIRGLVRTEPLYRQLATKPELVDLLESILGQEPLIFRDVVIIKPAREGAAFNWHQDSAYWDVDPPALVSAWIPLGDVPESAGPLRVIPGTHKAVVEHDIYLSEQRKLPAPLTRLLRRLVSLAGTGDNPEGAEGSRVLDAAKRLVLGRATRLVPGLARVSELQIDPRKAAALGDEVSLPVSAGSVVLFHSLLLHASNPNTSEHDRRAAIISYMGASFRFTGRGEGEFLPGRSAG
jgi:ectoine hydroxylase-related dioxygenase (phytanoyl-CoA dioxygenase family)